MISLKKFFKPDKTLIPVKKNEKEVLECFIANRPDFEQWLQLHPQPRIRFRFYYPNAIDFYYDEFKLFTAFFRPNRQEVHELTQLKMSEANYSSISTANWQPFATVICSFLQSLEAQNKQSHFLKTKSLHDYAAICSREPLEKEQTEHLGMAGAYPLVTR